MPQSIRFTFAPAKVKAALHHMVREQPGIDLHTALKACYFADKAHLNEHGRPIFGATYKAMRYGPVPLEIYEIAKGEPMWLAELDCQAMPWRLDGFRLRLEGNETPDLSPLSDSDMDAIRAGLALSSGLTFTSRTALTHGPDWQAAQGGIMRYEDMIADGPGKDELVADLLDIGPRMRL